MIDLNNAKSKMTKSEIATAWISSIIMLTIVGLTLYGGVIYGELKTEEELSLKTVKMKLLDREIDESGKRSKFVLTYEYEFEENSIFLQPNTLYSIQRGVNSLFNAVVYVREGDVYKNRTNGFYYSENEIKSLTYLLIDASKRYGVIKASTNEREIMRYLENYLSSDKMWNSIYKKIK